MLKLMGNVAPEHQGFFLTLMERGVRRRGDLGERGEEGRARFTGSQTPVELQ